MDALGGDKSAYRTYDNKIIYYKKCEYLYYLVNSKRPNGLALILPRHNVELFHQTLVQHCCENISAVENEKANQKIVKHIVQRRVS